MSIRIHTAMGWGLTDVKTTKNGQINDPRFKPNFSKQWSNLCEDEEISTQKFLTYFRKISTTPLEKLGVQLLQKTDRHVPFIHRIVHATEGGNPKIWMALPLFTPDWYRYNDSLDYSQIHDTSWKQPELLPTILPLVKNPYPYLYDWYAVKEKRLLTLQEGVAYTQGRALYGDQFDPSVALPEMGLDPQETYAPIPPPEVRTWLTWLNPFKDPQTIYTLRPLQYTWWF